MVKVINEDYSDSYPNKSVCYMNTNETLNLVVLAALVRAGCSPWWSKVQQILPFSIVERGNKQGVVLR